MLVETQEKLVLAQTSHRTVGGKQQREFIVDGHWKVLQCLVTAALRYPEAQLGNDNFKTVFIAVQRLLQFRHQCGRWLLLEKKK